MMETIYTKRLRQEKEAKKIRVMDRETGRGRRESVTERQTFIHDNQRHRMHQRERENEIERK
jgi:hypothetical protein